MKAWRLYAYGDMRLDEVVETGERIYRYTIRPL